MARNEARRQKRLAKRRQKAKLRHKAYVESHSTEGTRRRIRAAARLPVHQCLINSNWRESGLAQILLSRKQDDGTLIFGVYLVDILCLGLKNTFCNADVAPLTYESKLLKKVFRHDEPVECSPALARAIVYGAIDYARRLHFQPQADFRLSRFVLGEPDPAEAAEDVEFGRDGKPLYISGPHDAPAGIVRQLETQLGPDGFHFMVGGPAGHYFPEEPSGRYAPEEPSGHGAPELP